MKAWTQQTYALIVQRAESGWVIRRQTTDYAAAGVDVAGLSDDQALLEFFAEQLALPAPTLPSIDAVSLETVQASLARHREIIMASLPAAVASELLGPSPNPRAEEAPAAAMVPPPVSALPPEVMAPFVDLGRACRYCEDPDMISFKQIPGTDDYADVEVRHVRALLIAAGLFTDEMRPSQPQAVDASVKPAEGATSPPADADGSDSCSHCGAGFFMPHEADCPSLKGDEVTF